MSQCWPGRGTGSWDKGNDGLIEVGFFGTPIWDMWHDPQLMIIFILVKNRTWRNSIINTHGVIAATSLLVCVEIRSAIFVRWDWERCLYPARSGAPDYNFQQRLMCFWRWHSIRYSHEGLSRPPSHRVGRADELGVLLLHGAHHQLEVQYIYM